MSSIKMRSFVEVECPPPVALTANGVYNFFTPDERTSEDTALEFQGSFSENVGQNKKVYKKRSGGSVSENNLVGLVPRYVMLNFQKPTGIEETEDLNYDLSEARDEGILYTSEELQSPHDLSFRSTDLSVVDRLRRKLEIASNLSSFGFKSIYDIDALEQANLSRTTDKVTDSKIANKINIKPMPYSIARNLINSNIANDIEDVNEISSQINVDESIVKAQTMSLFGTINRSYVEDVFSSSPISRRLMSEVINALYSEDDYLDFLGGNEIVDLDVEILADSEILDSNNGIPSKVELAGYMIERYETGETVISSEPERTYFISRPSSNSFLDVRVKYGVMYTYTVRSVYRVTHTIVEEGNIKKLTSFLASDPTDPAEARVIEFTPPNPPDGVMYHFNYGERRGLRISWQYPVGSQRDTKYFQIFRRKSINEPFTCIGMIDFDNSTEKSPLREFVRDDKVLKYSGAVTYFEDSDFYKDSKYIYAVCAVDAHGYTSGYSVQTKVSFIKSENRLVLKRISKHGAPKQYPNFFVDPDEDENTFVNTITQDAMKTSEFNRMRIYFDPDGLKYRKKVSFDSGPPTFQERQIFYVNRPGSTAPDVGVYKLVMINTDRQKAQTIEISIEDARGTGFFPA